MKKKYLARINRNAERFLAALLVNFNSSVTVDSLAQTAYAYAVALERERRAFAKPVPEDMKEEV